MKKHIAASAVCALCMAFCAGAAAELPAPPEIPQGDLRAQVIAFEPGKTYKVFDEAALWHMNADGAIPAVSTDNWIQVFGRDGDTILIQYPVDETHMRFGYIQADALPEGAVETLEWDYKLAYCVEDTPDTVDPLGSKEPNGDRYWLGGVDVYQIGVMGDWAYIENIHGDWIRGFVPLDRVRYGRYIPFEGWSDGRIQGEMTIALDGTGSADLILPEHEDYEAEYVALRDGEYNMIGKALPVAGEPGRYAYEGAVPEGICEIRFSVVRGEEEAEIMNPQW